MKKQMKQMCVVLLAVTMVLEGPAGNVWAGTGDIAVKIEEDENGAAGTAQSKDEVSIASESNAEKESEKNDEAEDGEELGDSVLIEDEEESDDSVFIEDEEKFSDSVFIEDDKKEYDRDFTRLISDLKFLHADDFTEITEDDPIMFGEDAVVRFFYNLDEIMLEKLEAGESIELEYQLPDDLLAVTDSSEELVNISIEAEQENVLDGQRYVDILLTVDGKGIEESPWEVQVECEGEVLRKELFVSVDGGIALASMDEDFEIDENVVLVKYNGEGGDVVIPEGGDKHW